MGIVMTRRWAACAAILALAGGLAACTGYDTGPAVGQGTTQNGPFISSSPIGTGGASGLPTGTVSSRPGVQNPGPAPRAGSLPPSR